MTANRQGAGNGIESDAERERQSRQSAPEGYWPRQSEALARARKQHESWTAKRRKSDAGRSNAAWKRVTLTLPRAEAQQKAREFFAKYPKAAYWSEVESWRELPGDIIEFTLRRLPSAD